MPGPLPPAPCPDCGAVHDDATVIGELEDVLPEAGDFSCCLYCGCLLRFDRFATAFVRRATPQELQELAHEAPEKHHLLLRAQRLVRRLRL